MVHGNVNRIPYYNSNYDDPAYLSANQMSVVREFYGSVNQTFIIDGSGVYVTRNSESYLHGRFELSDHRFEVSTCFIDSPVYLFSLFDQCQGPQMFSFN